jgi:2-polyprenyl-3-methyl-5-hydroxy-6-metoxy-1,4-benzoquinol methylase/dihydrodipicolinate reductase
LAEISSQNDDMTPRLFMRFLGVTGCAVFVLLLCTAFFLLWDVGPSEEGRVNIRSLFWHMAAMFPPTRAPLLPVDELLVPEHMKVCIVGAAGYIGAALHHRLKAETSWRVIGYDTGARASRFPVTQALVAEAELREFDVVVHLGEDPSVVATRMSPDQVLMFASTMRAIETTDELSLHRELVLQRLSQGPAPTPKMVALRFATMVGVSPSQRVDLLHTAMIRDAFVHGQIEATHSPESTHHVLWMEDLVQAMKTLISGAHLIQEAFSVFQLASFTSTTAQIVNSVAAQTHTRTHIRALSSHAVPLSPADQRFKQLFRFRFQGTNEVVARELVRAARTVSFGREVSEQHDACRVCGSKDMVTVIDLGHQPPANDFRFAVADAMKLTRHPLRLMRCRQCHHTQLAQHIELPWVFQTERHLSSQSAALQQHFEWMAEFVTSESNATSRRVLEIACNDGAQLDALSLKGWSTYGVEAAANIAELARAKSHHIQVGLWGHPDSNFTFSVESFDAILAQNVLAHVPDPVAFMTSFLPLMNNSTRVYVQTSQCEMHEKGQFDAVHHEHVSFFTVHSFSRLAREAHMKVVDFRVIPIHGKSCLVTFMRNDTTVAVSERVERALERESLQGITEDWFYLQFRGRALAVRQWIHRRLSDLAAQGHRIVGYGASSKGMVMLHFLQSLTPVHYKIEFVVDDSLYKFAAFCPGTDIEVTDLEPLRAMPSDKRTVVVVLDWNRWDEIAVRIAQQGIAVIAIVPFPVPRMIALDAQTQHLMATLAFAPPMWTEERTRSRAVLVTHYTNDAAWLPFFVRHHAPMFDAAILVDVDSTDASAEIIRLQAPESWKVVRKTRASIEEEIQHQEAQFPGGTWTVWLNVDELLVHPNLRRYLDTVPSGVDTLRFPSVSMASVDPTTLDPSAQLIEQHTRYVDFAAGTRGDSRFSRQMRRGARRVDETNERADEGFVAKFTRQRDAMKYMAYFDLRDAFLHEHTHERTHATWRDSVSVDSRLFVRE